MREEQVERLVRCFKAVFPKMSQADILTATQRSVTAWDSVAHVTLVTLIAEEFAIDLDFEDFDEATSFASILEILDSRLANA